MLRPIPATFIAEPNLRTTPTTRDPKPSALTNQPSHDDLAQSQARLSPPAKPSQSQKPAPEARHKLAQPAGLGPHARKTQAPWGRHMLFFRRNKNAALTSIRGDFLSLIIASHYAANTPTNANRRLHPH